MTRTAAKSKFWKKVANYLEEHFRYSHNVRLQGVIYLHNINATRMRGMPRHAFPLFRKICGTTNLGNVSIVTTRWEEMTTEEGRNREKELEMYLREALERGAKMRRHGNTGESAQQLLRTFLNNIPRALNIQTELQVEGKGVFKTEAGIHVQDDLNDLIKWAKREAEEGTATVLKERLERYLCDRDESIRQSNASNAPAQGSESVLYMGEGMQPWKEAPLHVVPSTSPFSEQGAVGSGGTGEAVTNSRGNS